MTHSTPTPQVSPGAGWHLVGETKLSVQAGVNSLMQAWLTESLLPLCLNETLLDKILASATLAAERSIQAVTEVQRDHIHLRVYTSAAGPAAGKTWGFFQTEKVSRQPGGDQPADHAVVIYLYLEE
jgi:hypothetical protein